MAKKKKAAANPARGFATTSIASKPRPEPTAENPALSQTAAPPSNKDGAPPKTTATTATEAAAVPRSRQSEKKPLSPEEFENQLLESELQLLVEKHAQKIKRDAQRQRSRLETDRRLLRANADSINSIKWLPDCLVNHILEIIKAESRFAASGVSLESSGGGKMPPEEDLITRAWTLQLALTGTGFADSRVRAAVKHIVDIAPNISSTGKDFIWGLEEALEWLARECDSSELPAYENRPGPVVKEAQANTCISLESPTDTPGSTRSNTPRPPELQGNGRAKAGGKGQVGKNKAPATKKISVTCDSDIEPDNLAPEYLATKKKLLELERGVAPETSADDKDLAIAKAEARIKRIENDVLFDKFSVEQEWKKQRIAVEKEIGEAKKQAKNNEPDPVSPSPDETEDKGPNDEISEEAKRIAAEILADNDDDDDLAGLFDSLPQNEVDEATGEARTVVTSSNGVKVLIKDFGQWTGVSPRRVLEETCRSRDGSVKINYAIISEASFANRHAVDIFWTKPQEVPVVIPGSDIEIIAEPSRFTFTMNSIATPDAKQSEAYIATTALFYIFSGNTREEKVSLRLPPAWRDLFSELGKAKKNHLDSQDRDVVKYLRTLKSRTQLPMWGFRDQVLRAVDENQVVIICAFLLEHQLSQGKPCKVYCTEPRRISALSLARRVSEELGENRNDLGTNRSLVGYSIRLEANVSKETRLVYATTGIVMRMLEGSNDLQEVTHLVLDEVHERSIDSDFLLIVLKRLLQRRNDLKVVLMSATVDAERFSAYLGGAPVLNVPGRTFPVEVRYLEDALELTGYQPTDTPADKLVELDDDLAEGDTERPQSETSKSLAKYSPSTRSALAQIDEYRIEPDLVLQLIAKISSDNNLQDYSKAILVFLPGIAEIRALNDLLLGDPRFSRDWLVYPLHSTIATEDQEAAFLVPPPGTRKVVLATNIAETGITIPDVTCVIDTGKHREMRYDERRQLSRLIDTFISRANAKQRRGRAGRVQQGLCFHMFTKYRHDNLMNDQQTPEMLRLSLQDLAIRVKICKIGGIEDTLGDALDPPSTKNIRRAIDALIDVRALTAGEDLTPLGHQLARLPLDVFLGKLILLGTVFKCLDVTLTVAAILSSKSPFSAPFGQRAQAQNAKMLFRRGDSDLLTVYNAYLAWKRVCQANSGSGKESQFCRKNFLSQPTLANIEDLKGQLLVSLADSGFLPLTEEERQTLSRLRFAHGGRGRKQQQFFEVPHRVNLNSDNDVISSSIIAWSFYPRLLVRDAPGTRGLRNIGNNQSISLHPSSVNRNQLDIKWMSYYHIMQAKTVYHAHEATSVEPFSIALLCGDMFSGVIILDGNRGRFALPDWKTMLVVKVLRTRLRELLTRSFKQPGKLLTAQQEKWLEVWQRLYTQEFTQDHNKA
ncbi:ATP-dependent RNA helicase DHX29 [Geosmithia morbida]|uniref:RNA helicase n=1 Tax=Geosmithia morbida TaxID=1094350 RepID=A0A9P5D403_9HYPO|nr:ATP-dependent RNA helicase DHX29 [Geosmithia morbida]KAF4121009.1 ATP-dependent RNA helicase DHX29 [Geosmithia morbida]